MQSAIVTVKNGIPDVAYQSEDVYVTIINLDRRDLYLYGELLCRVTGVNDDGTVNLLCVDTLDGSRNNHRLMNIPVIEISFYSEDEEDLDDLVDYEDDW